MSSLRSLRLSARQFIRPCSLSHLQASSSRLFVTEATTKSLKQSNPTRTVIIHGLSSLNDVSEVLDKHVVGPVEEIEFESERKRAFISFLGVRQAQAFQKSLKASQPDADVRVYRGEQRGVSAPVIAAIALRSASRCVMLKPSPLGMTEESLAEDLRRFGPIEKVEVIKKPDGDTFATVHFCSISSALKAVLNLRVEQSMKGSGILFAPDRLDYTSKSQLKQTQQSSDDPYTVVLSGLQNPTDSRRIVNLVQNATPPSNGSVLSSLILSPQKTDVYLNFFRPKDATLFANAFNSTVPKPLPGSGSATLLPRKSTDTLQYRLARAAEVGVSRTLAIFNIKDWARINNRQIFNDFSKFGYILNLRVDKSHGAAYIEFADVMSAIHALDRIHSNRRNFRRYTGTCVSFAHPKEALKPVTPLFIQASADPVTNESVESESFDLPKPAAYKASQTA